MRLEQPRQSGLRISKYLGLYTDIRITTEATFIDNGTDIVLIFGSRGVFRGITLNTTTCDKTSLLRIDNADVTCPTP